MSTGKIDDDGNNAITAWFFNPALILLTIFLGLCGIVIFYFMKWIDQTDLVKKETNDEKEEKSKLSSNISGKRSKKEQTGPLKTSSKKKLSERESHRRNTRGNEKGFNHPWLLATLKGHTGRVLNMDFSANGKYLVSCADEDPDPGGLSHSKRLSHSLQSQSDSSTSSSSSSNDSSSSVPPSSSPSPILTKGLSRRQRKNRRRDSTITINKQIECSNNKSEVKNKLNKVKSKKIITETSLSVQSDNNNNNNNIEYLEEFKKMALSYADFVNILKQKYLLTKEDMGILGYPLRLDISKSPQNAIPHAYKVFNSSNGNFIANNGHRHPSYLDVFAREFFPKIESGDSGNGSGSSSEEDSSSSASEVGEEYLDLSKLRLPPCTTKRKDIRPRRCTRCGDCFYTTSTKYITLEKCCYHPGKIQTHNGAYYGPIEHSCCKQPTGSPGCEIGELHVWSGTPQVIVNSSYVETEPPKIWYPHANYGVFSLDCEMSYTVVGLEVVKVSVVDIHGKPVYNEFVRPLNKVVDFNTRYSGVTKEDFIRNRSKSLAEVQRDLKRFICSETVLIGHGLENDLKGLKMLHKTVVDTAFTFPHYRGLPYKRPLRNLALTCLGKKIQCGDNGHDSFEDARTCMELMIFRIAQYSFGKRKIFRIKSGNL